MPDSIITIMSALNGIVGKLIFKIKKNSNKLALKCGDFPTSLFCLIEVNIADIW